MTRKQSPILGEHGMSSGIVLSRGRGAFVAAALAMGLVVSTSARAQVLDNLTGPLKRLFDRGVPVAPQVPVDNIVDCPRVDIIKGAAALRVYAGAGAEGGALRHQISIVDTASECVATSGGVVARVGLAGRALLGPSGAAGTFTAPVTVLIKRGDAIVARRARTVSVAIPPSGQQGAFSFIEEGIAIPAGDGVSIEAGVGNIPGGPEEKAKGKNKRR